MARWLKIIGAFLFAACFALPMSSCTVYRDETGYLVELGPDRSVPPGARAVTTRHYLLDEVSPGHPQSWLWIAAFIWPAAFLLHARKRPDARLSRALWFIEPQLLAGSLYSIFVFRFFDDRDVGSYVGFAGVAVYFLGWVGEAFSKWRSWKRRRLSTA